LDRLHQDDVTDGNQAGSGSRTAPTAADNYSTDPEKQRSYRSPTEHREEEDGPRDGRDPEVKSRRS
jgi:hypothetical protein